jgi:AcrR family transcriptional regulator
MARRYQLKTRAERQAETRRRIVEAAIELHGVVGPARTTIAAIAERAGVERPTVYRHFPTEEELFRACSSTHWARHTPPDPEAWRAMADPRARLRTGLSEMYASYREHEQRIWNVLRDAEDSALVRKFAARRSAHRDRAREVLLVGWGARGGRKEALRAAIGHALDFFAWRSLHRQGISDEHAIAIMATMIEGARCGRL